MEAELIKKIAKIEAVDLLMKKYCWNGSGIDDKILLIWKQDWWKHIGEMEVGLMKNIPEMEAGLMKNIADFFNESGIF